MLIIICGSSSTGKSTLARFLSDQLPGEWTSITQDDFYHDRSHCLLSDDFFSINHDLPSLIDFDLANSVLETMLDGLPAKKPIYLHQSLSRLGYEIIKAEKIIYEGIYAALDIRTRLLANYILYLHCPKDILLDRRIYRDQEQREVKDKSRVFEYFTHTALPTFEKFGSRQIEHADLCVDTSKHFAMNYSLDKLLEYFNVNSIDLRN
jgi:uridine kinase